MMSDAIGQGFALLSLTEDESSHLELEASRSWASIPEPPEGLTKGDIIRILLASSGYHMNPSTFVWSRSNDVTYHSLWIMCQKLSARGSLVEKIRPSLMGRSSQGYARSRGVNTSRLGSRGNLLRDDGHAYRLLKSAGIDIRHECYDVASSDVDVELTSDSYVDKCIEMHIIKQCQDSLDL